MTTPQKTINYLRTINIVPRWIILLIDLFFCSFAILLSFVLQNNFSLNNKDLPALTSIVLLFTFINLFVFISLKTFVGIVRYTGIQDAARILISVLLSAISFLLLRAFNLISLNDFIFSKLFLSLYTAFSFFLLLGYRIFVKQVFIVLGTFKRVKKNVVIYGAGSTGLATKRIIALDTKTNFNILAFIDDDKKKQNKTVDGVKVICYDDYKNLAQNQLVDELIIAVFRLSPQKKNVIVDFCLDHEINILSVPPYSQWADGRFAPRQLRTIKIEELLERETIEIRNGEVLNEVKGKRILVTGAAGSIGSELVRQLIKFSPDLIILCDQAETPLHNLDLELKESLNFVKYIPYLSSVTDVNRMESLYKKFKPNYVYHAAAYKHVPMMEFNPIESVKVNVLGTKVVANLSLKYGVERFVMVSTDKAVNPTNVMGASKRLAEMFVQSLHSVNSTKTRFITTRFGNVLGSNGSVILRFKDQIERGGPVTVTHPNITRYFMTIPEACQLVLEAGIMGNGGEVFVFDMGNPVKISDLAKKMIRLYGLVPNIDINIHYTGVRPGEKLFEELLTDGENVLKTYHDKIMIAKVRPIDFDFISQKLEQLNTMLEDQNDEALVVAKIKEIVPEFISQNSIYSDLDSTKIISLKVS